MQLTEIVNLGRDNAQVWVLDVNGVTINHTLINRAVLVLNSTYAIDSAVSPGIFDFTNSAQMTMKLGLASIPPGTYTAELIIFDNDSPVNGYSWSSNILLYFRASIIPT